MNAYRHWFLASRPWSFVMSVISVTVGVALAAVEGVFFWTLWVLTLVGIVLLHAATNLMNDYFDVRAGVDRPDVYTAKYRPHPLVEGKLNPMRVWIVSWVLYGLAAAIGLYLAATRGWWVLGIGLAGAVASLTYTAPPLRYKYYALGELFVFLVWGPLMVEGSYYVQTQALSARALWIGLPLGALVAVVLLANNVRDLDHDSREGILTLPILLGRENSVRLYMLLIGAAYGGMVLLAYLEQLSSWALLVFLSLPLAVRLVRTLGYQVPADADARTAALHTTFGLLLVISLILERLF